MTDSEPPQRPNTAPLNPSVFYGSIAALALVLGASALAPEFTGRLFADVQKTIVTNGSWYYALVVAITLACALVVALTPVWRNQTGARPRGA